MWRATGRQDVANLHGHTGGVVGLAFAPDGRRLASISRQSPIVSEGDGTVRSLGRGPEGDLACASRPLPGHLPGGLQPRRPLDRLGGPGRRGAPVGRGDRRAVRDPASPRRRVGLVLQPGRNVAAECERQGRPAMDLGRGNGSRPHESPGSRRELPLRDRPLRTAERWPRRRSIC